MSEPEPGHHVAGLSPQRKGLSGWAGLRGKGPEGTWAPAS